MFIPNLKPDENDIRRIFEQNLELETFYTSLLQVFQGNKLTFCDFLYFSFLNDLYREKVSLALKALYLRAAQEIGLNKYIQALWIVEQEMENPGVILLFSIFTRNSKFNEIFKIKADELRQGLEALAPNFNHADSFKQLKVDLANLPFSGPDPCVFGVLATRIGDPSLQFLDNFEESEQICERVKAISSASEFSLSLELPLPLPYEIPIGDEELLTPFPLMLESPILNPCIRYNAILKDLFSSLTKLSEDELSVY